MMKGTLRPLFLRGSFFERLLIKYSQTKGYREGIIVRIYPIPECSKKPLNGKKYFGNERSRINQTIIDIIRIMSLRFDLF
jgi:hypothetical protein